MERATTYFITRKSIFRNRRLLSDYDKHTKLSILRTTRVLLHWQRVSTLRQVPKFQQIINLFLSEIITSRIINYMITD